MTDINCEHIIEKMPLLLDNQLPRQKADAIFLHIRSCPTCSAEYDFFCKTRQLTGALSAPKLPDDFHARLMHAVAQDAPKPALRPKTHFYRKAAGFAATAAVLALSALSFISMQNGFFIRQTEDLTASFASPSIDAAVTPQTQASLAPDDSNSAPDKTLGAAENTPSHKQALTPEPETFSKEPSLPATHNQETAEDAPLPAATNHENNLEYKVYRVFLDQSALPLAEEKLQSFTKDENGYRIETEVAPLLSALSALSGYRAEETPSPNGATYILLFTNE